MSMIMDNRIENSNNDKEEEVRKLQELVKKLEIQNEELRSERHALLSRTKKENESLEKNETEKAEKETNPVKNSVQEKNETVQINSSLRLSINLDDHGLSDEETWLFDSPKANPHKDWLRKDINDPSLVDVKKSLVKKLDEITNSPRHSPRHSLYSPSSSSGVLSPESPPSSRGEIDTRTFIRPKKRRSLAYDAFNDENKNSIKKEAPTVPLRSQNGSREYLAQSSGSLGSEEDDRLSSASDGSYSSYRLTDVEDVNTLARLQEESLKFPEPRPAGRYAGALNMRGSNPSIGSVLPIVAYNNRQKPSAGSSGNSATSSQEDLLTSPPSGLLQPSPRRTPNRSGLPPPRRYPSSGIPHPSSRENSDMSTPPDSPYTSQQNLETCNGKSVGSRLPSLTRRLGGSDPRLLDSTSPSNSRTSSPQPVYNYKQGYGSEGKSVGRSSRLQTPQARGSRLSAPSPVRIPLGTSQVVEVSYAKGTSESAHPRPNSSALPRPGSGNSRLQTPKSRISPSPMKFASQTDWREGCY